MTIEPWIKFSFQGGVLLVIVLTSLQLIRKDDWWIRSVDFLHAQITFLNFVFLAANLITFDNEAWWDWIISLLGVACLVYQVIIIFPYTRLSKRQARDWQPDEVDCISILESNVLQPNTSFGKLIALVEEYDPDLLIALETDRKWAMALTSLERRYVHKISQPQDNTYGMLLFSKHPIIRSEVLFLIDDGVPSMEVEIEISHGRRVRLYVVHPQPPAPGENHRSTERDAELIVVGRKAKECEHPVIVAGDLNDVAWSHTTRLFQRISGLLDPRIGRGFYNTFHASNPLLRWPLDHIFHSGHFSVRRIERLPSIDSDHFPLFIELCLHEAQVNDKELEPEQPDEEDISEARDKLKRAKSRDTT